MTLEALWGPAILPTRESELIVGVATVDNALHLVQTSGQPALGLLEAMRKALIEACTI